MELHNSIKGLVISKVNEVFDALEKEGNNKKYCICDQCRMDVCCFVLNQTPPRYVVSSRGVSRVMWEDFDHQQRAADITALVNEGLKQVSHNQRPNFPHANKKNQASGNSNRPVYNVPTIVGRIFNGENFAPLSNVDVELLWNGELVSMKNGNWQNPCRTVRNTEGNFSFWPAVDTASDINKHKIFEYILRVSASGFETLTYVFKIPVASEILTAGSFTMDRTFKLPDLYMFPPGEAEKNGYLG
jgi:competence protein ComFB